MHYIAQFEPIMVDNRLISVEKCNLWHILGAEKCRNRFRNYIWIVSFVYTIFA